MQNTQKGRLKKVIAAIITLVIAAGSLYLALRRVDWHEMLVTLSSANLALLAAGVLTLGISCFIRGIRWHVLLSAEKSLPVLTVFWTNMVGYLGNSYLPARAGEVMRSVFIGQKAGISKSFSLATALVERIVDAILLVFIGAAALAIFSNLPPQLLAGLRVMAGVGAVGVVGIIIAPRLSGPAQRVINVLPVSEKLRGIISGITEKFLVGAGALQRWSRLWQFLLYSAVIWSLDTVTGLIVSRAFGLSLNPIQVFILLAALGLFSAIPSTPGYVGVYQAVAVLIMVPFGFSEAQSVAYIIGYQGVQYATITILGLIGLWKIKGALTLRG